MSNWEIQIIQALRDVATNFFDILFEAITFFGEKEVLIVLLIFIYFIYSKKVGQRMAFAIFSSLLLNNVIKGIVMRERPWKHPKANYQPVRPETATGSSFPSGHTQNSAVTYTSFALEFKKKSITIVVGVLVLLIGFSRIYLGVHYPTDVVAGIALGISCAVAGTYLHHKCENSFRKQYLLYIVLLIIFLPFIFIFWRTNYQEIMLYRDFYTSFAFFAGYVVAIGLEYRFVNFINEASVKIKIIRAAIALILVVGVLFGLKTVLPKQNIMMDMLRYFLIPVIGLGLYPIITKKVLFITHKQ
ncbi:MAG: phosphatase PAP2 family protein [Bacilli bacterium]|nr:phosphatase PAP2 family protein [Bacilli bacterium]MDD4387813.1 phosphatase PAP2 family protein [Bacilli bacterium]